MFGSIIITNPWMDSLSLGDDPWPYTIIQLLSNYAVNVQKCNATCPCEHKGYLNHPFPHMQCISTIGCTALLGPHPPTQSHDSISTVGCALCGYDNPCGRNGMWKLCRNANFSYRRRHRHLAGRCLHILGTLTSNDLLGCCYFKRPWY